ncbi:MAG: F-type H+-transporting ATPase subunit gamma [Planctomycetota bacterium]|jgi:F-type H+-transporting ATPase subunit gamma
MANLKELRGRIKSVSSIAQITGAMEMVASMKLRKVQAKAQSFAPYTTEIRDMIQRIAAKVAGEEDIPLFTERDVKTVGFFLVTSDRGLCGSYNSNLLAALKKQVEALKAEGKTVKFWVYGRKGYTWLMRRGYEVERLFAEPALDKADFSAAKMAAQALVEAFTSGTVDEMRVHSMRFISMAKFKPAEQQFLPIRTIAVGNDASESNYELDFLIEPDASTVFNALMPRYLETVIFDAMLQALTSEHASRRMAMKGATDAAGRMTKDLKKVYNRARQESITKELLDIIGGASAVS